MKNLIRPILKFLGAKSKQAILIKTKTILNLFRSKR